MEPIHAARSNSLIIGLAAATLVVLGGVGAWLIHAMQARPLLEVVRGDLLLWHQIAMGIVGGTAIALGAWWIISRPAMRPVMDRYAELIGPLMPVRWIQWLVSICAGVGEELFFRGAIQHWLGIPFTAVLFVALHGYLDPRDGRVLRYGLFMTGAMLVIGWWAVHFGLMAPMIAHTVIDAVLIARLVRHWRATTG